MTGRVAGILVLGEVYAILALVVTALRAVVRDAEVALIAYVADHDVPITVCWHALNIAVQKVRVVRSADNRCGRSSVGMVTSISGLAWQS